MSNLLTKEEKSQITDDALKRLKQIVSTKDPAKIQEEALNLWLDANKIPLYFVNGEPFLFLKDNLSKDCVDTIDTDHIM